MVLAEEKILVLEDEWRGLYREGWKGQIVEEAFAHPAKFARALIRRIYDHVCEEGWCWPGDRVIDPFGGVALGALDAMRHGLHWTGSELEEKFVSLGNQNIELWRERYELRLGKNWGTAALLQGDSRRLTDVIAGVEMSVSSPPYIDSMNHAPGNKNWKEEPTDAQRKHGNKGYSGQIQKTQDYGKTVGQLGAMPEGNFDAAISSPPYISPPGKSGASERFDVLADEKGLVRPDYGSTLGQISELPEGDFDACISSPPYAAGCAHTGGDDPKPEHIKGGKYHGVGITGCVSSPPYEQSLDRGVVDREARRRHARERGISNAAHISPIDMESHRLQEYGATEGNIGNQRGEDFWSAARLIVEQVYAVLTPGGHACFVVKDFVRNKKRVEFTRQWAQLCEVVGFRLLHHHRAMLVDEMGEQPTLYADDHARHLSGRVERKSFFRRLAEQKGSPRIDWESVLCFEKPAPLFNEELSA
jgi:hypothetical protein